MMKLRPVTLQDADLLLSWRNDPQTRRASHNPEEIGHAEHIAWLTGVLQNPDRQVFIAEESGEAVGTVRADRVNGVYVLSWTVSPLARGRGVGKSMVALLASQLEGPLLAEVRSGNEASARIAEHAGLRFDREEAGVAYYRRAALS